MAHPFGVVPHPRRPHSAEAEWDPAPRDPAGRGLGKPPERTGNLVRADFGTRQVGSALTPRGGRPNRSRIALADFEQPTTTARNRSAIAPCQANPWMSRSGKRSFGRWTVASQPIRNRSPAE